jgi:hypothetical protein
MLLYLLWLLAALGEQRESRLLTTVPPVSLKQLVYRYGVWNNEVQVVLIVSRYFGVRPAGGYRKFTPLAFLGSAATAKGSNKNVRLTVKLALESKLRISINVESTITVFEKKKWEVAVEGKPWYFKGTSFLENASGDISGEFRSPFKLCCDL